MRERLDCAIFSTACQKYWADQWVGAHVGGRLYVHMLDQEVETSAADAYCALLDASMLLRRYDVCILPISEGNLGWARTALAAARGVLSTPVLALVQGVRAAALYDLYELGMVDFARVPVCPEEIRARVERLLDSRRDTVPHVKALRGLRETQLDYLDPVAGGVQEAAEAALCANILERSGAELEAFAAATASRCASSRESFRAAKSKVVERFERAYIIAALGRHSGNIAMAARAAQKHRRAFWALMRKHQIDAAPFRAGASPNRARDG